MVKSAHRAIPPVRRRRTKRRNARTPSTRCRGRDARQEDEVGMTLRCKEIVDVVSLKGFCVAGVIAGVRSVS